MTKPTDWYTAANKAAWEEAAPRHAERNQERLAKSFSQPGFTTLDPHIIRALEHISVAGASVAQLCCNQGVDLLSIKNLGAGRCVGFDQAEAFLEQGRELASAAGHTDVTFVNSDLYALSANDVGTFDVTMTTIGVIGWMPDLAGFFDVVAALTSPGGYYLMEEMHPVLLMYEPGANGEAPYLAHSYFSGQVFEDEQGLDYFSGESYQAQTAYSFQYTLADIMSAAMQSGLVLRHIEELPYDISFFCSDLQHSPTNPPLGITMLWQKTPA